ncbi:hypothetical protein ACAW74_05965 [Fibrella sp. WM1]|uniref:hypothetical protein n=1 Tax=Fibrella musci TaxID=3242485 RepID=UPI0035215FB5
MEDAEGQVFELGEQNILEEFYELIEKHRLSKNNYFQLGDFYDYLNSFDLAYQKFNTDNEGKESVTYINKYLTHSLYIFLVLFKMRGFTDRPIFYSFKRFIHWFSIVLQKNHNLTSEFFFAKNIFQNFSSLVKGSYVKFLSENPLNFNLYKPYQYADLAYRADEAEHNISVDFGIIADGDIYRDNLLVFGDDFSVTNYRISPSNENFEELEVVYEMILDFTIANEDNDAAKIVTSLSFILNSISHIENVKVEIESVSVGSLYARVRVYLKDLVAKEETKAVLEASKEIVVKTLSGGQVSYSEIKKANAEVTKIKAETELIEAEIQNKPDEFEAKMAIALDLEKKALENEQLKVQITKEKIEVINKLSDLATKGILSVDDVRIDINEVLYLLKQGNSIQDPNVDIDKIT